MAKADLTAQRLRELLQYDPETGIFTWRNVTSNRVAVGDVAGSVDAELGYIQIGVDGRQTRAHRLAFLWMTGSLPSGMIDHKNGNRADNSWSNLRDTTMLTNQQNRRRASKNNSNKLLGVSQPPGYRNRWIAKIYSAGKTTRLGSFTSPAAAHAAYLEAKRKLHPGCTI